MLDWSIAAILAQDGLTNAAVYAMLAMALVLVFSVTRVILLPQGEFVGFGALTMAALQFGQFPTLVWLLLAMGASTFVMDAWVVSRQRWRRSSRQRLLGSALRNLLYPVALWLLAGAVDWSQAGMLAQTALTLALVVPMGAMLYRLAFQPVAEASVLVLLIVSVAVHFALLGLALLVFGPEGVRTQPFTDFSLNAGDLMITGQSLVVIGVCVLMIGLLSLFFARTLRGKALLATAINRKGARLVGVGTDQAGALAFSLAAGIGALAGILIGPMSTIQYDTGFVIALKGFVAAIVGGLVSYPLAAFGALLVGLLESYASFWASAYKEVIVFTLILPVLAWRSWRSPHHERD